MGCLGECCRKSNPKGLRSHAYYVWIKVQSHQLVTFAPRLEPDMALVCGTPPQSRKIMLPLVRCGASDRESVLEGDHPRIGKMTGGGGRGELRPEVQGACKNCVSGVGFGHHQLASHASTVMTISDAMRQF